MEGLGKEGEIVLGPEQLLLSVWLFQKTRLAGNQQFV
jgi:hypothetical protein